MDKVTCGSQFHIERGQRRVLLVNPPVYDLRLDWARWQQPCGLLQLGAALKQRGADVRLLDFLAAGTNDGGRMTRRRLESLRVDGENLTVWCHGLPWAEAGRLARRWREQGWQPDEVWVTSLTSFWWRGAQETIRRVKYDWWPHARVLLGGVYPTLYPDHAAAHTEADLIVSGPVPDAAPQADLTLYDPVPLAAGIYLHGGQRSAEEVVQEISDKARLGVREIAFFDEEISGPEPARFDYVLESIVRRRIKARPVILGNLGPREVTMYDATLLHAAGTMEVYLRWQPALNGDLTSYQTAVDYLHTFGGFKPRAGSLNAIIYAGWPGENLEDTVAHLIHLAHVVGSVTVFPYQATREEGERIGIGEPDRLNGKLFPFAAANGVRFGDYADLLRLAATLNSKYRDVTFDFLGSDIIARMVRTSIRHRMWQPAPSSRAVERE